MTTIKHLLLTITLIGLSTGLFAQVKLGAGFTYGSGPDKPALHARAGYALSPLITVMADYNHYLIGEKDYRARTINFNGQVHFYRQEEVSAYGLAGLNLTRTGNIHRSRIDNLRIKDTTDGTAFNLGAGAQFRFAEQLSAFFEAKYIIGDFEQFVAGLGVIYNLDIQ